MSLGKYINELCLQLHGEIVKALKGIILNADMDWPPDPVVKFEMCRAVSQTHCE